MAMQWKLIILQADVGQKYLYSYQEQQEKIATAYLMEPLISWISNSLILATILNISTAEGQSHNTFPKVSTRKYENRS